MNSEQSTIQPKVAIIGHRGIPNAYGGFETLADELASCLVGLGCGVTVYCRSNYFEKRPSTYKGASLVYLPTIQKKSLDTLFHTFISVWHVFFKRTADVVLVVNVGNAPFAFLAKILGKKVILCVDGLDWQRKKWGRVARTYLRVCSYFAGIASHQVITDASTVYDFYKKERKTESKFIPYGTDIEPDQTADCEVLNEYGLKYKQYFTYVARFEPENNPMLVIRAHAASGSRFPLIMIGDNRYNPEFVAALKAAAGNNVIFTGYVFGSKYKKLVKNSIAYVRAAEVGGHSPALIEAMGRSVCVLANDKAENREPLGDTGLFFKMNVQSLAKLFKFVSENPEEAIERGKKAAQRAMVLYNWDMIAFEYYKIIKSLARERQVKDLQNEGASSSMKRKILITGAGGTLGRALYEYFSSTHIVFATTAHPMETWQTKLDITDSVEAARVVSEFRPDYIFHCAAMTDLEKCEKDLSAAYAVNTLGTKIMAQAAARFNAVFVYMSTANVFNGEKRFYTEEDEPMPLNVYGLTKHMGELMTKYYAPQHLVIRLGWLLGGGPKYEKKFVNKIIEQLTSGVRELHVVNDKYGTVSYVEDVAKSIAELMKRKSFGVYNVAAPNMVSRYDIAKKMVDLLGYSKSVSVVPVPSSYFSSVYSTPRPNSECLVSQRMLQEGIRTMRSYEAALKDYLHKDYNYAFGGSSSEMDMLSGPALA
jgi:dTDP-4-dehydrorhamnose reductase